MPDLKPKEMVQSSLNLRSMSIKWNRQVKKWLQQSMKRILWNAIKSLKASQNGINKKQG